MIKTEVPLSFAPFYECQGLFQIQYRVPGLQICNLISELVHVRGKYAGIPGRRLCVTNTMVVKHHKRGLFRKEPEHSSQAESIRQGSHAIALRKHRHTNLS